MNTAKTVLLATLSAFSCATPRSDTRSPASHSRDAIVELVEAHDTAWNAHDPAALAALFADRGTLVTPRGNRIEGRAALRDSLGEPGPTKETSSSSRLDAVQWLAEDLALIDASQTLSGPGVEVLGVAEAKLVAVVQRIDGEWRFVAARPHVQLGQ